MPRIPRTLLRGAFLAIGLAASGAGAAVQSASPSGFSPQSADIAFPGEALS